MDEDGPMMEVIRLSSAVGFPSLLWLSFLIFVPLPYRFYVTSAIIFGICILAIGGLVLLDKLIQWGYRKYKVEIFDRKRYDLLVGFGLIASGGWIPRAILVSMDCSHNFLYYTLVIYPFLAVVTYAIFLFQLERSIQHAAEKYSNLITTIAFTNLIPLVFELRIAATQTNEKLVTLTVLVTLFLALLSTVATCEFLIVAIGGVAQGPEPVRQADAVVPAPVAVVTPVDSRLECKICLLPYSVLSKTPRILKECGHTICQQCAENLLKKSNHQHLFCPFCQVVTVVQGPATRLPRNHTALEYLKKLTG